MTRNDEITMAQAEQMIIEAQEQGKVFDMGDGIKGRITGVKCFEYVDGVDEVEITPVHNAAYRAERRKMHDDYVIVTKDWLRLIGLGI